MPASQTAPGFPLDVLRRFRLAVLLPFLVLAFGTTGYVFFGGYPFLDAVYMTIITVTTVGYGEVHPLTPAARAFTMLLIVSGRLVEVYVLVVFAQAVVVEQIGELLGRRRMERQLAELTHHYIICGFGRMGQEIAEQLQGRRVPFVVVDRHPEICRELREQGILAIAGDASTDRVLAQAGIDRARGLMAVTSEDAVNIFITLSARALNSEVLIVARCANEEDVRKLRLAGANRVISPYVIGGRRIAAAALNPTVIDFLDETIHRGDMEWELEDIPIAATAPFAGRSLRDSQIRAETGCTILAVREAGSGRFHSNPSPDTILRVGDTLIVLGTHDQLVRLEKLAGLTRSSRSARSN